MLSLLPTWVLPADVGAAWLQVVVKSQILAGGRGLGKFTNGLQVGWVRRAGGLGAWGQACIQA